MAGGYGVQNTLSRIGFDQKTRLGIKPTQLKEQPASATDQLGQ
jgi:hypothetical protein